MNAKEVIVMLIHKKTILLLVGLLLVTTLWVGLAANLVDQNSVLAGRVLARDLVGAGVFVKEGTVLVSVESITGSAPAVRATRDGVVREVLVRPGDLIKVGQTVARIEPSAR